MESSREIDNPRIVNDTIRSMETRNQPIALQIIVVDDEAVACESISYYLAQKGFAVKTAASGREALRILREGFGDIVITDINMPAMNGLELTRQVRRSFPDVEIMLITGFSSEETVLQALKAGAADFFKKPVNMRELTAALYRCNRYRTLKQENSRLRNAAAKGSRSVEEELYLGPSPPSRKLREELELAAAQPGVTILLTGESGTGKELCARFIHAHGRRREEPFIAVNCAAIPETLLERELFGHEKGAFTDARERVLGVFELAGNGTVLLDEIGEMTLAAQTRLLRVVENRTFRRLGGTRERSLGACRLIAATNRNLEARVAAGEFRQDLYYRFQVLPIRVPPLRERKADLPGLCAHIVRALVRKMPDLAPRSLSEAALARLERYDFPGNIRELYYLLFRAMIRSPESERIEPDDLDFSGVTPPPPPLEPIPAPREPPPVENLNLEENEIRLIRRALEITGGNLSKSAELLGISYFSLRRRLEKYHIVPSSS